MFDLASIRNASFTLTPTGYNPEEVDQFLADLADQLAAEMSAAPVATVETELERVTDEPVASPPTVDQLSEPVARPAVDLDGLEVCVERTITSLDSFVQNELAAVKAASKLEIDEIHRERERLLEEAADAARAHLDDARVRAEKIIAEAHGDGDELRRRFEQELHGERERFEQVLAERNADAQARIEQILAQAEDRRREADEVVAQATRVQLQVLSSLEQARASIGAVSPSVDQTHEESEAERSEPEVEEEPRRFTLRLEQPSPWVSGEQDGDAVQAEAGHDADGGVDAETDDFDLAEGSADATDAAA
jgi:DivIVA domain-containing protein